MTLAILDPFSGISGDMTLGALIDVGLDPQWLLGLPARMGIEGIGVRIHDVKRGDIACKKVDFDIPPQPHGRHLKEIRRLVAASGAPEHVRERADAAFTAIGTAEGEIHGISPERVHLHEVGAVDAILDVVGAIWGLDVLGVTAVYCGSIALGDGTVTAAHGVLPVPAPATLKLLEGHPVRPGPEGSGELVTPTGAALVRVLSSGPPPADYVPVRSGFGAGTRDFKGRANALRIILAEPANGGGQDGVERLVILATDIDDMPGEYLSALAETLRASGALDVVLMATTMKKGRPGTRVEALVRPADVAALETVLLTESSSIGVRRIPVDRRSLPRRMSSVNVLGQTLAVKVTALPDGSTRIKPEFDDVMRVARETGRSVLEVLELARASSPDA
jgi:pyridinium-3,5-bisthiocarboxylic acid mononucleotide nickel chelatase